MRTSARAWWALGVLVGGYLALAVVAGVPRSPLTVPLPTGARPPAWTAHLANATRLDRVGRDGLIAIAWILVVTGIGFGVWALISRHLTRDLAPWPRDLREIGTSMRDHLHFHHPSGEVATRYNVLQKIAYTVAIFGMGSLIVLSGLAMSPRFDAIAPFVVRLLGGRQSARTLHFVLTFAFVGFTITHLFMVAVTGVVNNVRSMMTGWYRYRAMED